MNYRLARFDASQQIYRQPALLRAHAPGDAELAANVAAACVSAGRMQEVCERVRAWKCGRCGVFVWCPAVVVCALHAVTGARGSLAAQAQALLTPQSATFELVYNVACGLVEQGQLAEATRELQRAQGVGAGVGFAAVLLWVPVAVCPFLPFRMHARALPAAALCERTLSAEGVSAEDIQDELAVVRVQQAYVLQVGLLCSVLAASAHTELIMSLYCSLGSCTPVLSAAATALRRGSRRV